MFGKELVEICSAGGLKLAMDPGLMSKLRTAAGSGAKLDLSALTRGHVGQSEVGALQSQARKGLGGLNTAAPAKKIFPLEVAKDPFPTAKAAHDLTSGERGDLPKKDFAVSSKSSNTGKPAYPIEDKQHAIAALGFSKMHGDSADAAKVRAHVAEKYPDLVKKAAVSLPAALVAIAKTSGIMGTLGKTLASEAGTHKAELAGLGILAAPSLDEAQAHARAAISGDYNKGGVEKRTVLPHAAKSVSELAGLGVLAGPSAMHLMGKH